MKYKTYDKYKNSGIAWLGNIPEHWEMKRLKFIFQIQKRIAGALGYDVLSITQNGIKVKDVTSGAGQLSMDYSKYQKIFDGEFGMNHMDLLTGYVDISKFDGVISPDYRVFSLIDAKSDKGYLLRLLQLCYKKKIFYAEGQGAAQLGRWRMPSDNFKNFLFPVPPLSEQSAIARFLDYKLAKINRFIRKKKQLIKLLNEQKAAIINRAVTKGLDSNVQMKDSGIEWLGEVPKHWEVKPLKYICYLQRGHDLSKEQFINGEIPVYGSNGIIGYHNEKTTNAPCLTVGRSGSVGEVNLIYQDFWAHNTCLYVIRNYGNEWLYLFHLLKCIDIRMVSNGSAVPTLDRKNLHELFSPCPSLLEQQQIIAYIEQETTTINLTISKIEKEIQLVEEYKTTLISEAVTGKIDVRSYEIPDWEAEELEMPLEEEELGDEADMEMINEEG